MKQQDFTWTSNRFSHEEKGIEGADHLTIKALGVVHKYFFVPLSDFDLEGWGKHDHYRHHLTEVQGDEGDEVWIKPWIVGQHVDGKESILQFEPSEYMEEALGDIEGKIDSHKRGAIYGAYLVINRKGEGWNAVFGFRLDDKPGADTLKDTPVSEALCLTINGDQAKVEEWLDWAYAESA